MEATRKCSICKTVKPHSEFVKNKNMKHGITYACYTCKKAYNSKMIEKVLCLPCNMYITKQHFNTHLKFKCLNY
jgi:CMP-N-acetylneuraminic acid synthetase